MFCTSCGVALSGAERFCPQCGAPAGAAGQRTPYPAKRLARPIDKKVIGGVCAGFADYLGVDVTLMRIIWLCVAIFTGIGFIVYLVCWAVMPRDKLLLPAGAGSESAPPRDAGCPPEMDPQPL